MRNDKKWIIIKIEIEMKTKQKNNDDDDDKINWWETYFMNQSNQSINLLKWPEKKQQKRSLNANFTRWKKRISSH